MFYTPATRRIKENLYILKSAFRKAKYDSNKKDIFMKMIVLEEELLFEVKRMLKNQTKMKIPKRLNVTIIGDMIEEEGEST